MSLSEEPLFDTFERSFMDRRAKRSSPATSPQLEQATSPDGNRLLQEVASIRTGMSAAAREKLLDDLKKGEQLAASKEFSKRQLQKAAEDLYDEQKQLQEEITQYRKKLADIENEIKQDSATVEKAKAEKVNTERDLEQAQNALKEALDALQTSKSELDAAQTAATAADRALSDKIAEIEGFEKALQELEAGLKLSEEQLEGLETERNNLRSDINKATESIEELGREIDGIRGELDASELKEEELQGELDNLEAQEERTREQICFEETRESDLGAEIAQTTDEINILAEQATAEEQAAEDLIQEAKDEHARVIEDLENALKDVEEAGGKGVCEKMKQGQKRIRDADALHKERVRQATRQATSMKRAAERKKMRASFLEKQVEAKGVQLQQAATRKEELQKKTEEIRSLKANNELKRKETSTLRRQRETKLRETQLRQSEKTEARKALVQEVGQLESRIQSQRALLNEGPEKAKKQMRASLEQAQGGKGTREDAVAKASSALCDAKSKHENCKEVVKGGTKAVQCQEMEVERKRDALNQADRKEAASKALNDQVTKEMTVKRGQLRDVARKIMTTTADIEDIEKELTNIQWRTEERRIEVDDDMPAAKRRR